MTEAQEQAINKASQILTEHFDAHILAVTATEDGVMESENIDSSDFSYKGGYHRCLGLLEDMKHRMVRRSIEENED